MILSSTTINKNIELGFLDIQPFVQTNLKEASYTFTLSSKLMHISANQTLSTGIKSQYAETIIGNEGYLFQPNEFLLGYTNEKLTLKGNFGCLLSNRGSCAQIGLDILMSSTFAEPNTDNILILELKNISNLPILLYSGMPVVKGIFLPVN